MTFQAVWSWVCRAWRQEEARSAGAHPSYPATDVRDRSDRVAALADRVAGSEVDPVCPAAGPARLGSPSGRQRAAAPDRYLPLLEQMCPGPQHERVAP